MLSILKYFNLVITHTSDITPKNSKESVKDIISKLEEEDTSFHDKLLKYKEFKYFYETTKIQPEFLIYFFLTAFVMIVISLMENFITVLIGILYPMYFSIKSLREKNKEATQGWLEYWIIFFLFLNVENIFGAVFKKILPMYFFYKVVFLLVCYLPQFNGAGYFYNSFFRPLFKENEKMLYNISLNFAQKIQKTIYAESYKEDK